MCTCWIDETEWCEVKINTEILGNYFNIWNNSFPSPSPFQLAFSILIRGLAQKQSPTAASFLCPRSISIVQSIFTPHFLFWERVSHRCQNNFPGIALITTLSSFCIGAKSRKFLVSSISWKSYSPVPWFKQNELLLSLKIENDTSLLRDYR